MSPIAGVIVVEPLDPSAGALGGMVTVWPLQRRIRRCRPSEPPCWSGCRAAPIVDFSRSHETVSNLAASGR